MENSRVKIRDFFAPFFTDFWVALYIYYIYRMSQQVLNVLRNDQATFIFTSKEK